VERIINTIFDQIINAMRGGDRVELRGFGAFSVKSRQGRQAAIRAHGEPVVVKPSTCPSSRRQGMREQLNRTEP